MIQTIYAEKDDMAFIMEDKTDGKKRTLSVIVFYFGEPDESATEEYLHSLTAEFDED